MLCCVCLLGTPNIMSIFDELGEQLNIAEIINEHFWFKPQTNDLLTSKICTICWNKIDDFHNFYKTVEKAHQEFQKNQIAIKEEERICFSTIKQEKFEDEKVLENNLMQLDAVNKYKEKLDSVKLQNPLWDEENDCDGESDFECDISEEYEPSEVIEHGSFNEEKLPIHEENNDVKKSTKRKCCTKLEKNEDYSKKRKSRYLDATLSEEIIKKHIPMVCDVCDFVGNTFSDIKEHFKDHHADVKPYIICCNKKFDKNYVIANHACRHENPDCFRCSECNKSFTTPKGLRTHNIEFHGPEELKMHACEFCSRKFGRKNLLELHRQSHIPKEQWNFTCTKCTTRTFKFASQYTLNIHISMFHNRKINICHVCSKEIKDKKAFEKHVRLHFEESGPRIKCPVTTCERWLKDEDNVKWHIQRYHKTYKWSECRKALSSYQHDDEKTIDNCIEKYQQNENSIEQKNPLENGQNDVEYDDELDFECDKSEEYNPSEISDNDDSCNDESNDVKSKNPESKIDNQKITKRKASIKLDKNKNSTKKARTTHRLDPIVSEEIIKKHIQMVCDLCVFVGVTFQDIKEHFKEHHSNVRPYIMCCNRKFDRHYVIAQHACRHENPDCFRCNECNRSFTTPYGLRTHNIEHHAPEEDKMHACEYCPRKFQRKNVLEQHRPSHIPKDQWTFNCTKCTTRTSIFASQYLLNIHNSMFHRKEGNICHVCAKVIKDKKAFEKHVRYHFEDSGPRLKCPLPDCNRWLKDEDNLKTHMQLHNLAGKTYKCPECDKECPNRRALSGHIRFVHSKEIFRCEACDKTFKKALGLKEHMAQHTGESLYKCPFCPRTFNSNANMHSHKKKKHPIEWEELRRQKIGPLPSYTNCSN